MSGITRTALPQVEPPPELARSSRSPAQLTRVGLLSGTPAYIAPELADGLRRAEPPSDIFSFGVIACELLLGRRPFAEPAALALREGRRLTPVSSIARDWPEAPPALAAALDACLDFAPETRPSADELARLLDETLLR